MIHSHLNMFHFNYGYYVIKIFIMKKTSNMSYVMSPFIHKFFVQHLNFNYFFHLYNFKIFLMQKIISFIYAIPHICEMC